MVKDSLLKLYWFTYSDCSSFISPRGATRNCKTISGFYGFPRLKYSVVQSTLKDPIEKKVT